MHCHLYFLMVPGIVTTWHSTKLRFRPRAIPTFKFHTYFKFLSSPGRLVQHTALCTRLYAYTQQLLPFHVSLLQQLSGFSQVHISPEQQQQQPLAAAQAIAGKPRRNGFAQSNITLCLVCSCLLSCQLLLLLFRACAELLLPQAARCSCNRLGLACLSNMSMSNYLHAVKY